MKETTRITSSITIKVKTDQQADVLNIEGEEFADELGVALRLLWIRVHGGNVRGTGKLLPHHLAEFLESHKGLRKSVKFVMKFGKTEDELNTKYFLSPGYAACMHYLMENADGVDKGKGTEFWTKLITQDDSKGEQTRLLRNRLMKSKADREAKLTRDALVNLCIQAFNNYIDNPTSTLRVGPHDKPCLGGIDWSEVDEDTE